MKNHIYITFAMLFIALQGFGQNFNGKVLDSLSGNPVPFANIYLIEHQTGSVSDTSGTFNLSLGISGRVNLQISCIGYQTEVFSVDLSNSAEQVFHLKESHLQLHEVVVSTSSVKLQQDNIVSVVQKSIKEINLNAPTNLAEALSNIPGIDNYSTGSGIGKPVIRGFSGNRIVIYSQKVRIENQQWGDEHGLGVGEVGIENVEVIKGASSLLYGADALGGVLFFVDESYAPLNTNQAFISTKFQTNTLGTINNAGVKINKNNIRVNMFGSYSSHADYSLPNSDRVLNTRFQEMNFKTGIGFNRGKWVGNIRYSFLGNEFGITESDTPSVSTTRTPELPFQNINDHLISFDNTFFLDRTKVTAILGYNYNNREEFEESNIFPALKMDLNSFSYNLKSSTSFSGDKLLLLTGIQGMYQSNENGAEEILIPDAISTDIGAYATLNYSYSKRLSFEGGVRFDKRKISSEAMESDELSFPMLERNFDNFNFAIGSSFRQGKVVLRANLATGFRAPNTSELLSNGIHEGTIRYEIGDINLKSEKATQIDFSIDYQSDHFSLYINPFFNYVENYITLTPTDSIIEDTPVYFYTQTSAYLTGGEFGIHWHPHPIDWLHLESNFSSVFAEDNDGNALPLIPANKIQTIVKGELNSKGKVKLDNVFIEHIYRLAQDRTANYESSSVEYHLFNAGVVLLIQAEKHLVEISSGIKNIFNTAYIDHLSRFKNSKINNPGINAYLGLKLSF